MQKRDLLNDIFKKSGIKIDNKTFIQQGFSTFQGVLAGIALNDVWRLLNLPGNNTPINIAGVPSTQFSQDYLYQIGIAGVAAIAQLLFGVENGIPFGAGIFMGSTWANLAEHGHYFGMAQQIPQHPPVQPLPGAPSPQPGVPGQGMSAVPQLIPPPGALNPQFNSIMTPTNAPYNPMATVVPNSPLAHLP